MREMQLRFAGKKERQQKESEKKGREEKTNFEKLTEQQLLTYFKKEAQKVAPKLSNDKFLDFLHNIGLPKKIPKVTGEMM